MWNHHRSAAQSVLLFSLIIARLLPPAACSTAQRRVFQTETAGAQSFVGERQHSSSRIASVATAAAVRRSFAAAWGRARPRRWQAPAWATTSIPTVANSPLPWRLPRRHEDFPGFNRPLQPLWPLRLNPRYQLVLVMTIGLMMCLKP